MADTLLQLLVEGAVIARDVPVELTTESHDPSGTRWHGRLLLPAAVTLTLGTRCQLHFADGRRGDAEITRLGYGRASEPIRVFFRGQSPLR